MRSIVKNSAQLDTLIVNCSRLLGTEPSSGSQEMLKPATHGVLFEYESLEFPSSVPLIILRSPFNQTVIAGCGVENGLLSKYFIGCYGPMVL